MRAFNSNYPIVGLLRIEMQSIVIGSQIVLIFARDSSASIIKSSFCGYGSPSTSINNGIQHQSKAEQIDLISENDTFIVEFFVHRTIWPMRLRKIQKFLHLSSKQLIRIGELVWNLKPPNRFAYRKYEKINQWINIIAIIENISIGKKLKEKSAI